MAWVLNMKLLNSWKLYVGVIVAGFVIWVLAGILFPRSVPEAQIRSIYPEIKFWAETIGKLLVGVGGVSGSIKALLDLFRKNYVEHNRGPI